MRTPTPTVSLLRDPRVPAHARCDAHTGAARSGPLSDMFIRLIAPPPGAFGAYPDTDSAFEPRQQEGHYAVRPAASGVQSVDDSCGGGATVSGATFLHLPSPLPAARAPQALESLVAAYGDSSDSDGPGAGPD